MQSPLATKTKASTTPCWAKALENPVAAVATGCKERAWKLMILNERSEGVPPTPGVLQKECGFA